MSGYVDPEALLPKDESASLPKPATVWGWIDNRGALLRWPNSFRFNRLRLFKRLVIVVLLISGTVVLLWVGRIARRWARDTMGPMEDLDLNTPPRYLDLKEIQKNLPQHNLSLPYPEGSTGRYVKFSSQRTRVGWNNVLHEVLMLNHLAYKSHRAYVFQDYIWGQHHYPWPLYKTWEIPSRTPLGALIGGPTVGGSWEAGDPAPRSIHAQHWDTVCPKDRIKVIWTHEVKNEFNLRWATGKRIFDVWNQILLEAPEKCVEIRPPSRDIEQEDRTPLFDWTVWGGGMILDMWEEFRSSPVSKLLKASPIVQRAVERNQRLFEPSSSGAEGSQSPFERVLAVHVRRGDYLDHCTHLAKYASPFESWSALPWLPDRFEPPSGETKTDEQMQEFLSHCLPTNEQIVERITQVRRDYERDVLGRTESNDHFITTLYILTNAKSKWLDEFIKDLVKTHQWKIITNHDIVLENAQEKDVGMAIDMELARKSAIFLGNGWSSLTGNVLHQRLVDSKVPMSNRFF